VVVGCLPLRLPFAELALAGAAALADTALADTALADAAFAGAVFLEDIAAFFAGAFFAAAFFTGFAGPFFFEEFGMILGQTTTPPGASGGLIKGICP